MKQLTAMEQMEERITARHSSIRRAEALLLLLQQTRGANPLIVTLLRELLDLAK